MDTREWVFVLSVIAIVVVALAIATRWRRRRFDDIRPSAGYSSTDESPAEASDKFVSDELPAGGARTVGYRDPTDIEKMNDEIRARAEASKPRLSSFRPEPVQQQSLLLDDEHLHEDMDEENPEAVPLLLDPSDEHNARAGNRVSEEPEMKASTLEREEQVKELEDLAENLKETQPEIELRVEKEDRPANISQPERAKEQPKKAPEEPGEIIIINLMTEAGKPYEGQSLLKVVTELGLRHGEMQIFHYCGRHGDETPQFRMANLLKPGYFDIDAMGQTRTHALCFFFELEAGQDNMKIYESMLSVINKIRDELGGELHDENRSVFTIQTSEHCRNRIRDFQRKHLLTR